MSQNAWERLFFAEKIADYLDTLSHHTDFKKAVNQVLASVGDFYQADRAYLFEPASENDGHWNNTFEWCAQGVVPQRDALQRVAPQVVGRWMEVFEKEQSVIILNLAPLKQSLPEEWAVLERQNIQRLIVAPLRENGATIGFIGVDNPRTCIHDDTHVRVLASFLLARIRQDRNEHRYQVLLQQSNEDLLKGLQVGFWTIRRESDQPMRMIVNDTMQQLLGLDVKTLFFLNKYPCDHAFLPFSSLCWAKRFLKVKRYAAASAGRLHTPPFPFAASSARGRPRT